MNYENAMLTTGERPYFATDEREEQTCKKCSRSSHPESEKKLCSDCQLADALDSLTFYPFGQEEQAEVAKWRVICGLEFAGRVR